MEIQKRQCGILLHPTSLPSSYGIGDLGQEARTFLDKLAQAGVTLWQILPLGPTGYGDSPYSAKCSFAGNEYLIDLRTIPGFENKFTDFSSDCGARVDYSNVSSKKVPMLKEAAKAFLKCGNNDAVFKNFCKQNSWWLDDYALYKALSNYFNDTRWFIWENDIKHRKTDALKKYSALLKEEVEIYKALQCIFYIQWNSLHSYANNLGINIIGDIPIFCASDSSDVWANTKLFKIDENGNQSCCAGCPPDGFTPDGQMWGNPVYNWNEMKKDNFKWFRRRIEHTLTLVDTVRIDHFRGLESYWEIPSGGNASDGKWVKSPGMDVVKYFKKSSIIAEDLGVITSEVEKLLSDSTFPGMAVLQFAFEYPLNKNNFYIPQNIGVNTVVYTGTHDNQTTRGWFNGLNEEMKDIVRRYLQSSNEDVVWQMIRTALMSKAKMAVIPLQDVMGLDDSARMNAPSTVSSSNWSWRFSFNSLKQWDLDRLKEYISLYR